MPLKKFAHRYLTMLVALTLLVFFACETDDVSEDRTPPTVPGGLKTLEVKDTSVLISWQFSGDNVATTAYVVYQNNIQVSTDSLTRYRATNLDPETEYTYKIRALDAAGNISGFTPEINTTTLKKNEVTDTPDVPETPVTPEIDTTDTVAPTIPQNLRVTDITKTTAELGWDVSTDSVSVVAYRIFQDTTLLATVLSTEYSLTELEPDTEYLFSVSATDKSDNESDPSEVLAFSTLAEADTVVADTIPPTRPLDLIAVDSTENTIDLSWSAATDSVGVIGYRVFQETLLLATVTETEYQAIDLTAGTSYNFTVTALDEAENESEASDTLTVYTISPEVVEPPATDTTAPTIPANLTISNATQTTVDLRWDAATDSVGVTGYRIFRNGNLVDSVTATEYQVADLAPNTPYSFSISAIDAEGNESAQSETVSVTTLEIVEPPATVDKILVFTKTVEFRHGSIEKGVATLTALGTANDFEVEQTENAADFTLENLRQYQTVVFLSTTGDVLNNAQQAAFERYIQSGGSYMGIHAATDTEYDWAWYGRLVGAYFNGHPAIQQASIDVIDGNHPSTTSLPDPWIRNDEWYNFRDINPNINVLLNLDESTYNGGTNGDDHPIAWFHEFDGGRSFYTGGGHSNSSFDEPDFRRHLLGGVLYCLGR